jgi:hypothetical protein
MINFFCNIKSIWFSSRKKNILGCNYFSVNIKILDMLNDLIPEFEELINSEES